MSSLRLPGSEALNLAQLADLASTLTGREIPRVTISGANKGIGFEVARQIANAGWTVFAARNEELRGQAAARLPAKGFDVHFVHIDLNRKETALAARAGEAIVSLVIRQIAELFQEAKARAQEIAAVSGLKAGRVLSITDSYSAYSLTSYYLCAGFQYPVSISVRFALEE